MKQILKKCEGRGTCPLLDTPLTRALIETETFFIMFGSVLWIDPSLQQVGIDEQKAFGTHIRSMKRRRIEDGVGFSWKKEQII